jgi:hypothetical protein
MLVPAVVVWLVVSAFMATSVLAKPKRSKIECAKVSITKLKPVWGQIPPALQRLPPGASLCGVNGAGVAFITSELDAAELEKFYAPLFASVGCKPTTCKPNTFKTMECICPKGGDSRAGSITPQSYDQAFQLYMSGP